MYQILLEALPKEDERVIVNSQQGFTKGKAFLTKVIVFYDEIIGSVEKKQLLCLEFSKAFSTSHHILYNQSGKIKAASVDFKVSEICPNCQA